MTPKLFSELGLSPELLKAIDKLGFEQASPIQAEAIPPLLAGQDVVGQSQTGSGKTAAFAIPAIEKTRPEERVVQVLILCPTRELAVQVSEEVHKLALFKRGIHALPIYGGQSYERQFYGLKQGAQIVIGTPGRVMDHMRRGTLRLETVRLVILDEADVMLDMGFREDIEFVLQAVPAERQTVFFSATLPAAIRELIGKYARDPRNVRIEQKALTVPTVEQLYYEVDRRFKVELLTRLIDLHDLKLGIIFCNTKRMVDDLVDHLNAQGYSADRLHGDMSQAMRDRVMNKFRKSGLEFLVATDVAARGIDVEDVQVVFNYDLPYDPEDYVHRIGRTGRAGRSGRAISFVAGREVFQIRHIERYTNTRVHRARVPTPAEVEEARANVFLDRVRATLRSGEFKRQDHLVETLLEEGFSSTDIASALLHHLQGAEAAPGPRPSPPEPPRRRESSDLAPRPRSAGGAPTQAPRRRPDRPASLPAPAAPAVSAAAGPAAAPTPEPQPSTPPPPAPAPLAVPDLTESAPPPPPAPRAVQPPPPAPARVSPAPAVRATAQPAVGSGRPVPTPRKREVPLAKPAAVSSTPASPPSPPASARKSPPAPHAAAGPVIAKPATRSPRPEGEWTRLHMNVGAEMGVSTEDVVRTIQGETGLPTRAIGRVDLRERHLFVEVATAHAPGILAKLKRSRVKGLKCKVKLA